MDYIQRLMDLGQPRVVLHSSPNKIPISAFYITKTDGDKPFYNPVEIGYVDVNGLGSTVEGSIGLFQRPRRLANICVNSS